MKRILLVGNGFDIQFNDEFCQEKIISKFITNGNINLNDLFRFLERNYPSTFFVLEKHRKILEASIKKALVWSSSKDSIENIFLNVQVAIKEETKKIYLSFIDSKYTDDSLFLFDKFCQAIISGDYDFADKKSLKLSIWDLNEIDYKLIVDKVHFSAKKYVEIIQNLKWSFFGYLEHLVKKSKIDSSFLANKANTKLYGYDYIMTTNWTGIIDLVSPEVNNSIDHIHGRIDDGSKELPSRYKDIQILNIDDKGKDIKLDDIVKYISKFANIEELRLDIFGFSVENDTETIRKILKCLKNDTIYVCYYGYTKNDRNLFANFLNSTTQDKDLKKIKYTIHESSEFYGLLEYNNSKNKYASYGEKNHEKRQKKSRSNNRKPQSSRKAKDGTNRNTK